MWHLPQPAPHTALTIATTTVTHCHITATARPQEA